MSDAHTSDEHPRAADRAHERRASDVRVDDAATARAARGGEPRNGPRAEAATWSRRFDRQMRFAPIGARGQERLARSSVLIVGCGALGGAAAHELARCGVGRLVLADRDVVEETNLPRQVLFTPAHIGMPKVEAAARSLAALGGPTRIETHPVHVDGPMLRKLATRGSVRSVDSGLATERAGAAAPRSAAASPAATNPVETNPVETNFDEANTDEASTGAMNAGATSRAPAAPTRGPAAGGRAHAARVSNSDSGALTDPTAALDLGEIDVVLDGTDNLATRYLLNDWAVANGVPWVYAGVVGASGLVLGVRPSHGPCLRCLFRDPAPPGNLETCESAGVILPAVQVIASLQVALALRWLCTPREDAAQTDSAGAVRARLLRVDVWTGELGAIDVERDPHCPCCAQRRFDFLDAPHERAPVVLCGRNTVQIQTPAAGTARVDAEALCARLAAAGVAVQRSGSLVRFAAEDVRFTLFPDGRALLEGTQDERRARALYDRWIGR